MPTYQEAVKKPDPVRVLAYGVAKTRKTWWAGTAAAAGFNVIHLSAEKGGHGIFKHLPEEARNRIFVLDCSDELNRPIAAEFMALFCSGRPFYWHEAEKKLSWVPQPGTIHIDTARLTRDVVLVLDPWTQVVESLVLRFCNENNIDMTDPKKADWDHYRWCGSLATWMLNQMAAMPCHVVVVAHETVYEKRKEKAGKVTVEWQRRQVVSTSGPHAMTIARKFDEVLHFYKQGQNDFIEARGKDDADGGGRYLSPGSARWDDLPFALLAQAANLKPSSPLPPVADYFPAVTAEQAAQQQAQQQAKVHGLINPQKKASLFVKQ